MDKNLKMIYIADKDVDEVLDSKIRALLIKCFPHEKRFIKQRFADDMPKHRFIVEDSGEFIAHLAIHEKEISINNIRVAFLGIAEVCVDLKFRGHGITKNMLEKAESINPNLQYSILLGKPEIYKSSGYFQVSNIYFSNMPDVPAEHTMVKCLNGSKWADIKAVIDGFPF